MAIALDAAASSNTTSASSLTYSHTCTGSNRILFVAVFSGGPGPGSVPCTGVTYAGVAMTKIDSNAPQANWDLSLWYLINPASGANNVIITLSGTTTSLYGDSISYTGAKQSGVPDSSAKNKATSTSVTQSTTTVADNCWVVGVGVTGASTIAASTGVTSRLDRDSASGSFNMGDSNAVKSPAGSYSMTFTGGASDNMGIVMASFAPYGAIIAIGNGSYTYTGQVAGLLYSRLISAVYGAFAYTGETVGLLWAKGILAAYGAYTYTGNSILLATVKFFAAIHLLSTNNSISVIGQDNIRTILSTNNSKKVRE